VTLYRIKLHNWRLIDGEWIATEPTMSVVSQAPGGWSAWTEGDHDQQADETVYATAEEAMRRDADQQQLARRANYRAHGESDSLRGG